VSFKLEQFYIDLVTKYGPLGLGWPIAWYFVRQNESLQKTIRDVTVSSTQAITELKGAVQVLSEFVKIKIE